MKNISVIIALAFAFSATKAAELPVSTDEPVFVVAPDHWTATKTKSPGGRFPFETFRVEAPGDRNVVCLISIYGKDKPEFTDPEFLKTLLRAESRPYVGSPSQLSTIEIEELTIQGGQGFCSNFVDPDLVGKPSQKGNYKTATPVLMSIGTKYLIKLTILCDEINGTDYQDAITIVESIRVKQP